MKKNVSKCRSAIRADRLIYVKLSAVAADLTSTELKLLKVVVSPTPKFAEPLRTKSRDSPVFSRIFVFPLISSGLPEYNRSSIFLEKNIDSNSQKNWTARFICTSQISFICTWHLFADIHVPQHKSNNKNTRKIINFIFLLLFQIEFHGIMLKRKAESSSEIEIKSKLLNVTEVLREIENNIGVEESSGEENVSNPSETNTKCK